MTPSEEVNNATGEGPERVNVIEMLAAKRVALNEARARYAVGKAVRDEAEMSNESRLIDQLKILIPELERDAQVVLEAQGKAEAQRRLTGIARAYGSTLSAYQQDEARIATASAALRDAITTLNSRARKLEHLKAEADSLGDRFGVNVSPLVVVSEPQGGVTLPPFWRHHSVRPIFEQCEHSLRTRRSYEEIGGSPGFAIIQTAGLRPFRPLTEQECEVLEDREEQRRPDPVLARAILEADALGHLGVSGGRVLRR
jgi:hypothetical protein